MNKNKLLNMILLSLPIIFCVTLLIIMFINGFKDTDILITKNITQNISHTTIEIMKIVTTICTAVAFMLVIVLVILCSTNKYLGLFYFLNMAICYILNFVIKRLVSRTRPTEYMLIAENNYSFPSAHSMLAVAFYGYLAYIAIKYLKNKYLKIISVVGCVILTLLVGISRIFLGVHYTTDVLCGLLFGYIYLLIYIKVTKKYL